MQWSSDTTGTWVGAAGTWFAAVAAGVAVWVAWYQLGDVVSARRAQNYLELRKIFFEINRELDGITRDATYPDKTECKARNALRRYWYFVQTEYTLSSIDKDEKNNWEDVQLPLAVFALNYPSFRKAFLDMKGLVFTTGRAAEFAETVKKAYSDHYKKPIDLDYDELKNKASCPATAQIKP